MDLDETFWAKVQKTDGCWVWTGTKDACGYGKFKGKGAHRLSYQFLCGEIPPGLHILHSCDNPPCVNPSHLRPGTNLDNARDRKERGRYAPQDGENNANASLTEIQVLKILCDRRIQEDIAADYGIARSHISKIKRGIHWGGIRAYNY